MHSMNRPLAWLLLAAALASTSALAQEDAKKATKRPTAEPIPAEAAVAEAAPEAAVQALVASLAFKEGDFKVAPANATLHVGDGFQYLEAKDARRVLEDFWGNPADESVLGMVVPKQPTLLEEGSWAVVVTYSDDGHIDDKDAAEADYAKILKEMQEATKADNAARKQAGYPTVDLVGWATPPRYDQATKKIHWAKELAFDGSEVHTVNYDVRVLGRHGYLSLNAVAAMEDLPEVQAGMQKIIAFTEFDEGQRYADFDSKTDKIAAYGVAALVAGTLASKAGLFAKLGVLLLAGKKLLIPIAIGIAALFGRAMKKKKGEVPA